MTDRSPRRRIGLVLGLVAVTAGVAAGGDSPKSRGARPIFISPSGQDVEAFSLAGNARGDLAVVWGTYVRGHHRLWFRDRRAGGSFRRVHELPAGHAHLGGYYSVALARDGTEFVIWSQVNNRRSRGNGIRVAVRHPGGTFGSRHRLTRQFGADVDLAVSADGTAIATWTRWAGRSSQIVAAVRAPDGKWSPPQVVSHGKRNMRDPQVAFDGAGNATLIWERWPRGEIERDGPAYGREQYQVRTAFRPAGGKFGPPQLLSDPHRDAIEPYLAVGSRGDVAVFWGSEGRTFGRERIGFATREWNGGFGAPRWLTPPGEGGGAAGAIDPHGNLTAVWSSWKPCGRRPHRCTHLLTARRPDAGPFEAATSIGGEAFEPWLMAVDTGGDAFVVRTSPGSKRNGFRGRVEGRFLSADGSLGPYRHFSSVGDNTDEAAVLADGGVASIAWMHLVNAYTLRAHNRLKLLRARVRP